MAEGVAGIQVIITDLPGARLGEADGTTIYLDVNAAGHGWFVDSTPGDNSEFGQAGGDTLTAGAGTGAQGRMDLLTVLLHEIGHVIGFEHDDGLAVMDESLIVGQRVLLAGAAAVPALPAGC